MKLALLIVASLSAPVFACPDMDHSEAPRTADKAKDTTKDTKDQAKAKPDPKKDAGDKTAKPSDDKADKTEKKGDKVSIK